MSFFKPELPENKPAWVIPIERGECKPVAPEWAEHISKLESDLAECREVLAFYADGKHYSELIVHPTVSGHQCTRIALDGGEKAKTFLSRLGGK